MLDTDITVTIESDGVTESGGVLFIETPGADQFSLIFSDSGKYLEFVKQLVAAGNAHFGTRMQVLDDVGELSHPHIVEFVDDLARKTLGLPTDCDALSRPPTFQERHDANAATLAEIKAFLNGDAK